MKLIKGIARALGIRRQIIFRNWENNLQQTNYMD